MKNLKAFLISLAIPITTGFLSSLFAKNSQAIYQNLELPSFAPSSMVFPIVWTALYILMGIPAYLVYVYGDNKKYEALKVYLVSLVINFFWSIIFFRLELQIVALAWIIILLITIIYMAIIFYKQNKIAGYLQIPYILWVAFATILNLSIVILNNF